MTQPFMKDERRSILEDYSAGREKLYELSTILDSTEGPEEGELRAQLAAVQERQVQLWERYEAGVPILPISRCPFTGIPVAHSVDTFGLDGLWWDSDAPVRPNESLPNTLFAFGGAVKLGSEIEQFLFLCRPGPEAPYVVPRLLRRPEIRAVISSIEVGRHQAYPILYYAEPVPRDLRRINDWGTGEYWVVADDGRHMWDAVEDDPEDFDFDLEKWVRAGRLLWIAPGDQRLALHGEARRCPYLGLGGRRHPLMISMGRILDSGEPEAQRPGAKSPSP